MKIELFNFKKSNKEYEYIFEDTDESTNKILKIRTKTGWRTIDSPYCPEEEARQTLGNSFYNQTSIMMIGAGSGFLISEVLKKGIKDITLITPYRVIADSNLKVLSEYRNLDGNVNIIVADTFNDSLKEKLGKLFKKNRKIKSIHHPREIITLSSMFNPLTVYLEWLNNPVDICDSKNSINRVLFPCSGQIIEKEIIKEFKKRNIEVFDIDSFAGKRLDHKKALEIISEYKPDLIMSTNNKGSDREGYLPAVCCLAGVKWATWFLDDPRFIISKNEIFDYQKRFGFCWDISGVEALNELGFSKSKMLPLSTDPEIFYPGQGHENLESRIVYVGSPGFGNEDRYFSGLDKNFASSILCKHFENKILKKRLLPTDDEIHSAINDLDIHTGFSSEELLRLPAYTMYKANLEYRIKALNELADLNPIVYGDGWQGLLSKNIEIRNYVDYYRDLPDIYRSDAVHISLTHLQMRHFPNQRIFDAGACGSAVLGDRVTGWNELFKTDLDELVFDDLYELKQKAFMLLSNKKLRRDYGNILKSEVLSKHTYSHRIDKLIEQIFI